MKDLLQRILDGGVLSRDEATHAAKRLASGEIEPTLIAGVLIALRSRGETEDEVAGFAEGMRQLAVKPRLDGSIVQRSVDIVGTGGDGAATYNISTAAALLTASCGQPVVKHGNRAISSSSGAADVLGRLGIPVEMSEATAAACLSRCGFTFLFAPRYHPAVGVIAPVRKGLGVRTVFNMLGPMTNPARPPFGVIGAYSMLAAERMAGAFAMGDHRRVLVIHSHDGLDEPTPASAFEVFDVQGGRVTRSVMSAAEFGLKPCSLNELKGGDSAHNANAMRAVFAGEKSAHRDAVVLSSALALWCCGVVSDRREAAGVAQRAIDDGRALRLVDELAKVCAEGAPA